MRWMAAVLAPLLSIAILSGRRGCCDVALCREQEVDGLTSAVDRSIRVRPVSANEDAGFVHAPTRACQAYTLSEHSCQYYQDLDRPAMNRGVINTHANLSHQLLDATQAQRLAGVLAQAHQHHLDRIVPPLYDLAQRVRHWNHRFAHIGSAYHRPPLRQNHVREGSQSVA